MGLVLATIIMKPDEWWSWAGCWSHLLWTRLRRRDYKWVEVFSFFFEVWAVSIIIQPYFLLKSEGLSSPMYELQVGTEKLELQPKKNAYHFQRIYWLSRKLHKFWMLGKRLNVAWDFGNGLTNEFTLSLSSANMLWTALRSTKFWSRARTFHRYLYVLPWWLRHHKMFFVATMVTLFGYSKQHK